MIAWTLCNALSNVSLERNSVGFYQMTKIMVTLHAEMRPGASILCGLRVPTPHVLRATRDT